ncbi:FHA domain-containing protein [Comamonas sp. NLF-1-9]|uniref:FHA domain-containing protein n=1 Tax=Comamonas sp. NLF-1-9 TaxID=2853163 RepID=UPI001C46E08D|nr:FHA domain-containing protein [Comamonas sp. NLF-1-9]QXL83993.1 FHA domain-containing protein [Comamonas sp. NLF-1-9]
MPSLVFLLDAAVVNEIELVKPRTTLGRRPNNDIVIDNLTVSGEHAVLHMQGHAVEVEDLQSTNGTFVNGQPVERQLLRDGDQVIIGNYEVRFADARQRFASTPQPAMAAPAAPAPAAQSALVRVLTGPGAGREVQLTKVVTTLGKPGESVASITHRPHGYVLAQVDGNTPPSVNGQSVTEPRALVHGDRIRLADVEMEFTLR